MPTRKPNARGEPRPMAEATQERKLLGVGSTAWFGVGLGQQAPGLIRAQLSHNRQDGWYGSEFGFFHPNLSMLCVQS